MARDLRLFYLFRLLATSYLWVPISVAFMTHRGLDWLDVMLLSTLYSAVVILVEIPTGAFADRIGRRQSMMVGALAMVGSCLVAYAAQSFAVFAIAEALAATSMALCSGADSAYLFDLLHEHGRGDEYPHRESESSAWHYAGMAAAFLAGGALAEFVDLALPYLVSAGVSAAAFVVALLMRTERTAPAARDRAAASSGVEADRIGRDPQGVEGVESGARSRGLPIRQALRTRHLVPAARRARPLSSELRVYLRHMRQSVGDVFTARKLAWVIAYSAIGFVLLRATTYLYQPYLGGRDFSLFQIGAIFAAAYLFASFWAQRCEVLRRQLGDDTLAYGLLAALALTFLSLNQFHGGWAVLPVLAVQSAANGLYSPLVKTLLNRQIVDSDRRATILSVESIARRAGMGVFSPIAGIWGAASAMYLCGGIGVVGFAVLAVVATRGGLFAPPAASSVAAAPDRDALGEPAPEPIRLEQ